MHLHHQTPDGIGSVPFKSGQLWFNRLADVLGLKGVLADIPVSN